MKKNNEKMIKNSPEQFQRSPSSDQSRVILRTDCVHASPGPVRVRACVCVRARSSLQVLCMCVRACVRPISSYQTPKVHSVGVSFTRRPSLIFNTLLSVRARTHTRAWSSLCATHVFCTRPLTASHYLCVCVCCR